MRRHRDPDFRFGYRLPQETRKGDTHMVLTEARISTAQRSFGIAGLTRSELYEAQSFIEALRKFNSDIEAASERGWAEQAPDQSERDEAEPNTASTIRGMAPQPGRVLVRPAAKKSAAKSNKRPMGTYTRKQRVVLRRRAERGEFLVVGNLFVLVPNTRTKADAAPDTPDRQ